MGGKKVKLAFIVNDTARKATYRKRIKGFMKKLDEVTTLCEIDACALVYKPDDHVPAVWPSPQGVQEVLHRFMQVPELQRSKKMQTHESYLRDEIEKATEKLNKVTMENRMQRMTIQMFNSLESGMVPHNLSANEKDDLDNVIDLKLMEIENKMAELAVAERTQSMLGPEVIGDGANSLMNHGV